MRSGRPLAAALAAAGTLVAALLTAAPAISATAVAAPSAALASPSPSVSPPRPSPTRSPSPSPDPVPPTAPTNLRTCPVGPAPGETVGVGLCWDRATDNAGPVTYSVQRWLPEEERWKSVALTPYSPIRISASLVEGQEYTFRVVARDAAGNESPPSNTVTAVAVHLGEDTIPPSAPGTLFHCPLPGPPPAGGGGEGYDIGVSLCWGPATDNDRIAAYYIQLLRDGQWSDYIGVGPTVTSRVVTYLTEGQSYSFRVRAMDATGNYGPPTNVLTLTAGYVYGVPRSPSPTPSPSPSPSPSPVASPGGGDTTPPTVPQWTGCRPPADHLGAYLCWRPATDDVGVTGYDIYRRDGGAFVKIATHVPGDPAAEHIEYTDLSPAIQRGQAYAYQVVAKDAAGNASGPAIPIRVVAGTGLPSGSPSPTPTPGPSPIRCTVTYQVNAWTGAFTAGLTITNTGTAPLTGWTLQFAFPRTDQEIATGWNGTWRQDGNTVTVTSQSWNGNLPVNGTVWLGFNGTGPHTPQPTAFAVDEWLCATG